MLHDWFPTFADSWRISPRRPLDTLTAKQQSFLRLLSVASEQHLDVAKLVGKFADDHRWFYRWKLQKLEHRLAAGTPLVEALEQTPGILSDEVMLAIRFGTQLGALPTTYARLLEDRDTAWVHLHHKIRRLFVYIGIILLVGTFLLTFIFVKIFPSFQAINEDYELENPPVFVELISFGNAVQELWPVLLIAGFALAWLVYSGTSQRFFRRAVSSRFFRSVAQLRSAELLKLLAIALQQGRPLTGALSTLARYHYDSLVRHKLLYVRNEVEQGADIWDSMNVARLLTPAESRALAVSTSNESRIWTMRYLARWKKRKVVRTLNLTLEFVQPAIILLIALGVLVVALATFLPLIQLNQGLTGG